MKKNKFAAFALFSAVFLLICNGLDYLYATFITESGYRFAVLDDLLIPLAAAVVIGYFVFLSNKKRVKKET